ncbi:unnamed protein product [Chironomus riparius]|uniref:EGF-like domain-containing protein n=1 Tax=Chironomus riparius TaxID=315576 RepID=A0A9N9RK23_9DIPT|nr:unnamed protein product [Chironomus riparius]
MFTFNKSVVFIFILILALDLTDAYKLGNLTCIDDPRPVPGSKLTCNYLGCKLECTGEYRFPEGEKSLDLVCYNGRNWGVRSYGNAIPDCSPTCSPACLNGGICIDTNECHCSQEYAGRNCEKKIQTCPEKIPMPGNTMGKCIISGTQSCKVTCVEGHTFPDGTITSDLRCRNGMWSMEPRRFEKCEPSCNPYCQNGGTCIAPDICKCPTEFKGNLCQYTTDRCSPKKLKFNGLYACKGYYDKMECELQCPGDFQPSYEFAAKYTCKYSEGIFNPFHTPQCDYRGMNVQITHA